MIIAAIDPGTTQSALVILDTTTYAIIDAKLDLNSVILDSVARFNKIDALVIEMFKSYGMPVGDSVLESCVWIGRFSQAWGKDVIFIPRKTVVTEICGLATAKDKHIRAAVFDFYRALTLKGIPNLGVSDKNAVYSKFGCLKQIKNDLWAALALALCYAEKSKRDFKNSLTLL